MATKRVPPAVAAARGRLGGLASPRGADPGQLEAARRDLAAAKLDAYIRRVLAEAPPLTAAQLGQLRAHFRRGGRPAGEGNGAAGTAGP